MPTFGAAQKVDGIVSTGPRSVLGSRAENEAEAKSSVAYGLSKI